MTRCPGVLQPEALRTGGFGRQHDRTAQAAARDVDRRGAVQQLCVVDEVGGNHREIGHAQHRRVDAHAVPHHLRMRRARAAECDRRKRRPSVLLDEDRRIECQHVGHRQGNVLVQDERVELRFLNAYFFHGLHARHPDCADGQHQRRILIPPPSVRLRLVLGGGAPPEGDAEQRD